jgi:hypothetical protein
MGRSEASRKSSRSGGTRGAPKLSEGELRAVLDEALADLDADARSGSLLRAAGLSVRFRFPDLGMVLNVAPSDEPAHHLRWGFSDEVSWEPKLDLVMDSEVANAYLQGRESLAIGIVRGRVKASGDTRCALLYLPAMRLVADAYRRQVRTLHPHLELRAG